MAARYGPMAEKSSTAGVYEFFLEAKQGTDIRRDVSKKLSSRNYPILLMKSNELTLEEIFLKLTTGDNYGGLEKYEKALDSKEKEDRK